MSDYLKTVAAAAVAIVVSTSSAFAAGLPAGVYNVEDFDGFRSIWTPNGASGPNSDALVGGNGASAFWSFSNVQFDFSDGTNATMTGRATNTGKPLDLAFDLSLSFTLDGIGTDDGYCQFPGFGTSTDCSSKPASVDPSDWSFFNYVAGGSFTGVAGTSMAGLSYTIFEDSGHLPQAGLDANALELGDVGFSMWFRWTRDELTDQQISDLGFTKDGSKLLKDGYKFYRDGRGDINADLTPVPLPGAGLLLLGALGAGAAVARRKRA